MRQFTRVVIDVVDELILRVPEFQRLRLPQLCVGLRQVLHRRRKRLRPLAWWRKV